MKTKLAGVSLAAVAAFGAPAFAGGDVIYTGVKDLYAAAVPVPAPAPIPIYEPEYYVRFDVGAAWLSDGSLNETGSSFTTDDIGDIEPLEFGSIGAGRYITPSIRVELAVDWYTRGDVASGQYSFNEALTAPLAGPPPSIDTVTYDVTRQESVKYEQDTGMLNFYYDFRNSTRFTPYFGAGIGVTYRQLTRTASEVATCSGLSNSNAGTLDCSSNTQLPNTSTITEGTEKKSSWDFAAALMAGLSVQVTDSIIWDTGYRYMWQNGGLTVSSLTLAGRSDITIEDIGQHQLRTGIRLDLN